MQDQPQTTGSSLAGRAWSEARRRSSSFTIALVFGSGLHAAGHAFLAAAAGLLTRELAGGSKSLVFFACFGVVAASAKLVGGALAAWGEARIAGNVAGTVRLEVLDVVLSEHEDVTRGDRLAALTTHIQDIERGVSHGVIAELRACLQLAPLLVLLVVLAPKLALSALFALAAFAFLAFATRRAFKRAHAKAMKSAGALVAAADDAVAHAELWATYGAEKRIRDHVARIGRAIAREGARIRVRAAVLSSTSEVLGAMALVLALVFAAHGGLGADPGRIVPFAIAFFMAYKPLRDLVDARLARSRGSAALAAALALPPDPHSVPVTRGAELVPNSRGVTSVPNSRGVTSVPNSRGAAPVPNSHAVPRVWPLADLELCGLKSVHGKHVPVSARIEAGSIAVLVGPTGIGKSSLFRVLLGLARPRTGSVRYGEDVLDRAPVGPSARPFAWVPQDAPIVADTLAVNVGLGAEEDVDPRVVLDELGSSLGTDSVVASLSGGERQWVAVARAMASGLPVLLLDEPTSSLDSIAEARLLQALARLRGKRTIVLVTHRPAPIAIADVVIDLGSDRETSLRDQVDRRSQRDVDVAVE